jgi:large subunit ribosomal protein L32
MAGGEKRSRFRRGQDFPPQNKLSRSQKGQLQLSRIRSRAARGQSLNIIREKLQRRNSHQYSTSSIGFLCTLYPHSSISSLRTVTSPTMATSHVTTRSILSAFLPRLSAPAVSNTSRFTTLYSRQISLPPVPSLAFAIPSAIQLNVPGMLEGLWESILRAVPKKKTSHMKKRHRQMAGKALKDVTALNKCSACGHVKRAHLLCPYCVKGEFH